jgi:hypothetical protein
MLLEYSKKNIAILAFAQAAIVVLGLLLCRIAVRMYMRSSNLMLMPRIAPFVARWGWVALLVPVAWCVLAVYFFHRAKRPVMAEAVIPLTGLAVAALLAIFCFGAGLGGLLSFFEPHVTLLSPVLPMEQPTVRVQLNESKSG